MEGWRGTATVIVTGLKPVVVGHLHVVMFEHKVVGVDRRGQASVWRSGSRCNMRSGGTVGGTLGGGVGDEATPHA